MTAPERLTKGLFWDRAWKLVEGCAKVSPGCDNCWSERETEMRSGHPNSKIADRAHFVLGRGMLPIGFNGDILCREDNLDLPLRTQTPAVWAIWNDLFHDDVPDEFRDRAYAVMALCSHHTFLVLTKRSRRMADYWRSWQDEGGVNHRIVDLAVQRLHELPVKKRRGAAGSLPHVWHGVTAEDQERADERIPHLLGVPGHRFVSVEPMLGPVDVSVGQDALSGIHAVVLGGESGPKARPMHPEWPRSVRDQCAAAGVPFFFKQWGEWGLNGERVGKAKTGRELDGRLHNDLPWA